MQMWFRRQAAECSWQSRRNTRRHWSGSIVIRNLACLSLTLIRFRWLSIAGRQRVETHVYNAAHMASDLTPVANFDLWASPSALADKRNAKVNTGEKKKKELFIRPPSPILIPPIIRKGRANPSAVIFCKIVKGFFDKVRGDSRALIDSLSAICTETFHARDACVCMRELFLSVPNKRTTESYCLPFFNLSTIVSQWNVSVESLRCLIESVLSGRGGELKNKRHVLYNLCREEVKKFVKIIFYQRFVWLLSF